LQRSHFLALIGVGVRHACSSQDRCRNIHDVGDGLGDPAATLDAAPSYNQRIVNASLRNKAFEHAKWARTHLRPGSAILDEGSFLTPVFKLAVVPGSRDVRCVPLGTIVREEDDQGVVIEIFCFEIVDDLPDVRIHVLNHGCIEFHSAGRLPSLLIGKIGPSGNICEPRVDGRLRP